MSVLQRLNCIRLAYFVIFAILAVFAFLALAEAKTALENGAVSAAAFTIAVAAVLAPFIPLPSLHYWSRRRRPAARLPLFSYRPDLSADAVLFGPNGAQVSAFLHQLSELNQSQWAAVASRWLEPSGSLVRRYLDFHRRARATRSLEAAMATSPRAAALEEARCAVVHGFRATAPNPTDKKILLDRAGQFAAAYVAVSGIVCGDLLPKRDMPTLLSAFENLRVGDRRHGQLDHLKSHWPGSSRGGAR